MGDLKLLVLGSQGMLGYAVSNYFRCLNGFKVLCFDDRITEENYLLKLDEIKNLDADIIINCVGLIWQKASDNSSFFFINSVLPVILRENFEGILVHPSTDCVFRCSTKEIYHSKEEVPDEISIYGMSKAAADSHLSRYSNTLVIRASIIGLSRKKGSSLLDWFYTNQSKSVTGYTNHYWNGVTIIEWAKQLSFLIDKKQFGLVQIGLSNAISKFEILESFNRIFELNKKVIPHELSESCYKLLSPDIIVSDINKQLNEYKNFYEKHY